MEKNHETMKRKNMSIRIVTSGTGGGLAGLILLGGALATAALVSTFAFKRNQKSKKSSKVVNKDDGLSSLCLNSLSPQQNHHRSNGAHNELVSGEPMNLDETIQVNDEKDKEIDIPKKAKESLLCDESVDIMEEFQVPVTDNSFLKPEDMRKNDQLEENEVLKNDENSVMADSYGVGVVENEQLIPLEEDEVCYEIGKTTDENNKLIQAAQADQVGVDAKEHMPSENCVETREVIIEREEVFVEVPQSEQLEIDYDYHKLEDECDGYGQVLGEISEQLVEVAAVDKIRADDNPFKGEGESDDDVGLTIENCEELVGDVAANWIQLGEKSEFTTMYGCQDMICSDGTRLNRHDEGTCDVKKTDSLLPMTDISSLLIPANTKILEGAEADEIAVKEDSIEVEARGQTQLFRANEENKIYRETTNDEWEGADEIIVENDQQMQPCEEFQKNHINEDQKYISEKSSIEISSFPCNSLEVEEFSFPLLDSPPCFNFGNLNKDNYPETALHVKDVNPMEKDERPEIISENKPLVLSAKNDEMKNFNDGSENDVVEGEETLETGLVDIGQQTELSEQYKFNNGRKNEEESPEMIQTENFESENNQQSPLKEDSYYGNNVNREEDSNGESADKNEENSDCDSDEDDSVDGSSETTGDSSLDSNAEAIWPVESVQEFSEKVKDRVLADNHNYMETVRGNSNVNFDRPKLEEEDKEIFNMDFRNKQTAEITALRQSTNISSLKFWFLSLLVPFLLILWLLSSQISFPGLSRSHLQ